MLGNVSKTIIKSIIPANDITRYNCFTSYNAVACTRNVVLIVLSVGTAAFCISRVIQLHMQRSQAYHHYSIFYLGTVSCLVSGVNWVLGGRVQLHLCLHLMKLLQLLILAHFYWVVASRALRCEAAVRRLLWPALSLVVVYYLIITCVGLVNVQSEFNQCMEPYWLLMSGMEVILVQTYVIAAIYITRRLNEISTLDSVRWAQKRDLWCIVFVFEFSAIVTFVYDATIQIMGDRETGCGAVFKYDQSLYSPVLGTFVVIKLLVPVWAMLCAFRTGVTGPERDAQFPIISEEGTYGSAYSDDSMYRQLYHPSDIYHSVDSNLPDFTPSPTPVGCANPGLIRNSTSILTPISEEGSSLGKGKGSLAMLAAARNIPRESGKSKCFSWLRSPSPAKFYL